MRARLGRGPGRLVVVGAVAAMLLAGCTGTDEQGEEQPDGGEGGDGAAAAPTLLDDHEPLRDLAPEGVVIGTAAAGGGHFGSGNDPFTVDEPYRALVGSEFNSVTPENQLKWEYVHPQRDEYAFEAADDIVDFAEENGMDVRGHTLMWHNQNPTWLEEGDFTPDELREILREHISTVVGRYAGRIQQWDVANEIIDDSGNLRTQENIWLRELGPEIVADAFRWAHEADPDALLFLNDFNAETVNAKTNAYLALAEDLLAQGVPVHGFGAQAHLSLEYGAPGDSVRTVLQSFADLGLATAITELDVRMELDGEPTPEQLTQQAEHYRDVIEGCLAVEGCGSITVWGFTDKYSWVPGWFTGFGAATLTEMDYTVRPAYDAVAEALAG